MTVWKPLDEVQGYEVSADGQIRGVLRGQGRRFGRILSPNRSSNGYWQVRIAVLGLTKTVPIHRAVCAAFYGPCPAGNHVRHLDGDKNNNRLENLRYGTPMENSADTRRHGRTAAGEMNPKAKLTEDQVRQMRASHEKGVSAKELGARAGLCDSTVHRILNGTYWPNVSSEASNRNQDRATR